MVLKKMLSALGVGGPTVDTVLESANARPGETLRGQIHLVGGSADADIEYVSVGLVTRVEVETDDVEYDQKVEFHTVRATGRFSLAAGERRSIPFEMVVPFETPLTALYGQPLYGMTMGVRTELSVARAIDKSDLDPVAIHPLPAQEQILTAFSRLGFRYKNADLERGRIRGVHQQLPFYQEIEFLPPRHVRGINEVEVTFLAGPTGMDVILEADKRGGMFTAGRDSYARLQVDYATAADTDWAVPIGAWAGVR